MPSLWNQNVSKWVEVDKDFTVAKWQTTEPLIRETAHVQTATNGFIVTHDGNTWIESSIYGVTSRLESLLQRTIDHEREFVVSDYDHEKLVNAGYPFPIFEDCISE